MATTDALKIVLCFDGTLTSDKNEHTSYIGRIASYFMHYPKNSLWQIFQNCNEKNKYYFAGAGSDLCEEDASISMFTKITGSIIGTIDGHYGVNGIESHLIKIKNIVLKHSVEAKNQNREIELDIFSYSRGGFLAWRLQKELATLMEEHNIPISALNKFEIDPVPGTLFDRLRLFWYGKKQNPTIKINSVTYFSDTGNLNWWPFEKINTIFFSGLKDENIPDAQTWLVYANHEGINGRLEHRPDHPENVSSKIVLGHIVENAALEFDATWKKTAIANGKKALNKLAQQKSIAKPSRKFLNGNSLWESLVGKTHENIQPITVLAKKKVI